jgi:hypothetical protein
MLSAEEMRVDYLGKAEGLTLVMPVGKYNEWMLVTTAYAKPTAIFLDGNHRFQAIDCENNTNYKGLLVPNVRIEVDETSAFDTSNMPIPTGMAVRQNDGLFVAAAEDHMRMRSQLFAVQRELAECGAGLSAGFSRWQIVVGDEPDQRVLKTIDLQPK